MYVPILQPPSSSGSCHVNDTDLPNVIVTFAFPGAAGRSNKIRKNTEQFTLHLDHNTKSNLYNETMVRIKSSVYIAKKNRKIRGN